MNDELDRLIAAFMADPDDAPEKKYLIIPPENYRALKEIVDLREKQVKHWNNMPNVMDEVLVKIMADEEPC